MREPTCWRSHVSGSESFESSLVASCPATLSRRHRHGLEVLAPGAVLAPPAQLADLGAQRGQRQVAVGVGHVARDHDGALVLPALVDERVELLQDPLGLALGAHVVQHQQVHLGQARKKARCESSLSSPKVLRSSANSSGIEYTATERPASRAALATSSASVVLPVPTVPWNQSPRPASTCSPTSAMKRRTCRTRLGLEVGMPVERGREQPLGHPAPQPPVDAAVHPLAAAAGVGLVGLLVEDPAARRRIRRSGSAPPVPRAVGTSGAQHQPCPFWADGASPERSRYMLAKRGYFGRKVSATEPIGPFRCLAMIMSASPGRSDSSLR